jgi:hypothetical protein
MRRILPVTLLILLPTMTQAIEEPKYAVVRSVDAVEIRQYAPYVVAEVEVAGTADKASNDGFRILASYIFGNNRSQAKLEMTAPVTQEPVSVKLPMTVPVTREQAPGGFRVQFVLPRDVGLADAPVPLDQRITLREVPAARIAVLRFSGLWTEANYRKHLDQLQSTLRRAGLAWVGEPIYSRYNAPWTPWFMRRNEIWLRLGPDAG